MSKSIVNMSKWNVSLQGGEYNLEGIADKHPRLGRNVLVCYTSALEKAILENDILIYETRNTIYHCPLKYANINYLDNINITKGSLDKAYKVSLKEDTDINKVLRCFCELGLDNEYSDFTNKVIDLAEQGKLELSEQEKHEEQRLLNIVKNYVGSVYVEVSKISNGDILAYNIEGNLGVVKPCLHVGTIQDSILYTDNMIDFRYFPKGYSLQTYKWSENIENVVVKNMKGTEILFNDTIVGPYEVKIISRKIEE